jgi:hypothetical protein
MLCLVALLIVVAAPSLAWAERAPGERGEAPERTVESVAKSSCTVACGSLPSVSISCPGNCVAVERDCPSERGYVQCIGGAKKYCSKDCSPCFVESFCPEGGSVYCTGYDECMGGLGLCFVRCDGVYDFCPGHEGQILCESGSPF